MNSHLLQSAESSSGALASGLKRLSECLPQAERGFWKEQNILTSTVGTHVGQVLSNSKMFSKSPLPASLTWLVGDGTGSSDYADHWKQWNTLRPAKRRNMALHLAGFSPPNLADFWNPVLQTMPSVSDSYALCYEAFFTATWKIFFNCSLDASTLQAANTLRLTAPVASQMLSAPPYRTFWDRSLAVEKNHRSSGHHPELNKRRQALDLLVGRLVSPNNLSTPIEVLREWLNQQSLNFREQTRFLRFALTGMLLAAFENNASVSAWVLWLLAGSPFWQQRIVSGDDLALQSCLSEALRLYPPVWSLVRQVQSSTLLGEQKLEVGTWVWISPWVQGRQKAFWERPDEFLPERWEGLQIPQGQFFPFGSGLHSCPGEATARLQISSWIRFLLSSYRIERVENAPLPRPFFGVTQRPEKEVWLRFKPLLSGS